MSNSTENKIFDKTSEFKVDDQMREKIRTKIGYLIIQEFPENNISYVIGYSPYGKVWFEYEEVLLQYAFLMEDWQRDFDNNEIQNSKRPRIVKIFILEDDDIAGSDTRLNKNKNDDDNNEDETNDNKSNDDDNNKDETNDNNKSNDDSNDDKKSG